MDFPEDGVILRVENLKTYYRTKAGYVKAVDGVSLYVPNQAVVGVAGESGSGKSTLVNTIFKVLPSYAEVKEGRILYSGKDLTKMDEETFTRIIRWKEISWIPQVSMDALDPVYKVKDQMLETILTHQDMSKAEAMEKVYGILKAVNLGPEVLEKYPHELSGGQKQRVVIAMALLLDPKLVIADEPTTALDVIVQAQIMEILKRLKAERNLSMMFISHDLALLSAISDYIAIMYAGKIVEFGRVEEILKSPLHPYTQALLEAIPDIRNRGKKLKSIPGTPPDLLNPPPGCRFNPRCPFVMDVCRAKEPDLVKVTGTHYVACHLRR